MTGAQIQIQKGKSTFLDTDFVLELRIDAEAYDEHQKKADYGKWVIAQKVNEMWPEHKGITDESGELVFSTKMDYFAACSFEANRDLKRIRFSTSGETLRRWCEVQETYNPFPKSGLLLEFTSFEHMRVAKQLAYYEKVSSPLVALEYALEFRESADEMKFHFDPPEVSHEYDKAAGWFSQLCGLKFEWVKNKLDRDEIKTHLKRANEIMEKWK